MKTRASRIKAYNEIAEQEFELARDPGVAEALRQGHLLRSIAASLLAQTKGQEDLRRRPF